MLTFTPDSIPPVSCNHSNKMETTIHEIDNSTLQCCAYGECYCSSNCKDIGHVLIDTCYSSDTPNLKCMLLSCNLSQFDQLPKGIDCSDSEGLGYFNTIPGYWFSNGFAKFVEYCPQGHCINYFDLNFYVIENGQYPVSNNQCVPHWTGLACGECGQDNFIMHDSTSCVSSSKCNFTRSYSFIAFLFLSLFYWITVISLIFVLLHFKFDITAGYAYGIMFYCSVLEQTVNASYIGTHKIIFDYNVFNICLSILSSIGNLKPPFQILKMCFWRKTEMIDHMFVMYFHPAIVTCLIVMVFISARNFVAIARTIGRYINSKSICILLILSYSSVSYISLQLLRPLAINRKILACAYVSSYYIVDWHIYLSPALKYFHGRHIIYCIIAIFCELIIGIGLPFILLFQQHLTRYCNINFTSIKPVIDQLKGCYKEEYRWFAAYYLICRQVIYAVDIATDFLPNIKYTTMLTVYILIMMVHVWLQPYKQRKLNMLDSSILMTLMLVFIGEHTTSDSTLVLLILPLVLFINCITFSSRLKYILIPVSCLGIFTFSFFMEGEWLRLAFYFDYEYDDNYGNYYYNDEDESFFDSFYAINFMIQLISSLAFLAYIIYVLKCLCVLVMKRCHKPEYRLINGPHENTYEGSDSNEEF